MGTRRAWAVWLLACCAYIVGVMQRSSFGVVGIEATERFGASAGIVSTFVMLQLLVYAGMQIPAGLLLDRVGTRVMLTIGMATMATGQVVMAFADSVPEGIVARILVGAGDAGIFGAVVRLIPTWFEPRRAPLLVQMTAQLGQIGQIGSAVLFLGVNARYGWTVAFLATGLLTLAMSATSAITVRDTPSGRPLRTDPGSALTLRRQIGVAWRHPATRVGLASHFTTCFCSVVFSMMWGIPYLQQGEGLSPAAIGALMTLFAAAQVVLGPVVGMLATRHPERRIHMAFGIVATVSALWGVVILWPGHAPLWLIVALVVGIAANGPGGALSLDITREHTPTERLGTAIGVANMGGFIAGLCAVVAIGFTLDLSSGNTGGITHLPYELTDFKIALATQFVFLALGSIAMAITYRQLRQYLASAKRG